jgi:hypothetical protein
MKVMATAKPLCIVCQQYKALARGCPNCYKCCRLDSDSGCHVPTHNEVDAVFDESKVDNDCTDSLRKIYEQGAAYLPNVIPCTDGKFDIPAPDPDPDSPVLLFLGANQNDSEDTRHSDGARASAVRHLYRGTLYTIGSKPANPGFPYHLVDHFDKGTRWTGNTTGSLVEHDHATRTNDVGLNKLLAAHVLMLDYQFLVRVYLLPRDGRELGYSNEWAKWIAPGTIRHGPTLVLLLPNDVWKMVEALRQASEESNQEIEVLSTELTLAETQMYHPLWYATAVAHSSPAWCTTVDPQWQKGSNLNALREYLNPTHPFIMMYDGEKFQDRNGALEYLQGLKSPHVIEAEQQASFP